MSTHKPGLPRRLEPRWINEKLPSRLGESANEAQQGVIVVGAIQLIVGTVGKPVISSETTTEPHHQQ
jgi:hypothetical protein